MLQALKSLLKDSFVDGKILVDGETVLIMDKLNEMDFRDLAGRKVHSFIRVDRNMLGFILQDGVTSDGKPNGCSLRFLVAVVRLLVLAAHNKRPKEKYVEALKNLDNAMRALRWAAEGQKKCEIFNEGLQD